MKRRFQFLWIDDDDRKVSDYKNAVEAGYPGGTVTATVTPLIARADLLQKVREWSTDGTLRPDLVMIDHIFTANQPLRLKGSSVAHLLRTVWPKVPMVCVTAMYTRPRAFDQEDLSEYTAVFEYPRLLDDHLEELYAIGRDFPKLIITGGDLRDKVVATIRAPKSDQSSLKRILPEEFRTQQHNTTQHRMASWIFNTLMMRPGFLYDKLRASTLFGLTEKGFDKVALLFERAKYSGPFATRKRPLWWVSQLQNILYANVPDDASDMPQLAGRMLPNITSRDHSVCYVSRVAKNIPDVVARVDARSKEERQVCSRFTAVHPDDVGVRPGFEGLLVIAKPKKK